MNIQLTWSRLFTTMANAFLSSTKQHKLKLLCRVIYYSCTVSLVLLYIYVYYSHIGSFKILERNPVAFHTKTRNVTCSDNTFPTSDGCLLCPNGTFGFTGWSECEPLLNCSDIALQVHPRRRIPGGMTKWLADWKGHQVVYVKCSRPSAKYKTLCLRGMTRMEKLQGPFVTSLIGRCYETLEVCYIVLLHLMIQWISVRNIRD